MRGRGVLIAAVLASLFGAPVARAADLQPLGTLTVADPSVFGGPVAAAPGLIGAVDGPTVDVFAEPATGWSDAGPSAELVDPGAGSSSPISGIAMSSSIVVTTYDDGRADVYEEPDGGWSGQILPAAQLADSSSGPVAAGPPAIVGDAVLVSDEGTPGVRLPSGAGAWVDVFHEPPGGWSGQLTESARLEDSDGTNTYLDGASSDGAIADADPSHGANRTEIFTGPADGWTGVVGQSATLDTAATTVTGRAPASAPVVVDGDLVFAEPPGGWAGVIRPVALLESLGGDGLARSVAGGVVLSSGCRLPVGTADSGCGLGEWLFDPPDGEWSGTIAAPLAATDGEGDAGSAPPLPVLVDDATIASPQEDGTIDVDRISGVNAYRYRAPAPSVTTSSLRETPAGPIFSLRVETRRSAPTGGSMTVSFPPGLRLAPYATTYLNQPNAVVHRGRLTLEFGTGPGRVTRIDFGDSTLHETRGFRSGRLRLTFDYAGRELRRTVIVGRASR